jgi:TolB-like protein/DNA-binding winged helix-turn-helix (wHTH) protein
MRLSAKFAHLVVISVTARHLPCAITNAILYEGVLRVAVPRHFWRRIASESLHMSDMILQAGPFRLDLRDERLWRDGQPVRLSGKPLALLRCLMERPQTLVTKDEIFDLVWPNLTLSEAVLTTAVKELRQALGDSARTPQFIETVHRRGYRFLLPVGKGDGVAGPDLAQPSAAIDVGFAGHNRRRPLFLAVGGAVLAGLLFWLWAMGEKPAISAAPHPKSIAVLPFRDFSQGGDQRWFADGLTEEILNTLARTPDLRVAARTATTRQASAKTDLGRVTNQLRVAHILDGSIRREGERVRVTVVLVDATNGQEVWSQSYDRAVDDVIGIQEDIAYSIASSLKTVIEPSRLRMMVNTGTRSVEAYQAYLQGLAAERRQAADGSAEHLKAASGWFEQARSLDPNFAVAHWKAAEYWFGKETRINTSIYEESYDLETRYQRYLERINAAIGTSGTAVDSLKYRATRATLSLQTREAFGMMREYLRARPRDIDAWEEMADISAYANERKFMAIAGKRLFQLSNEAGAPRSRAITVSTLALDLRQAEAAADDQLKRLPSNALTQYQAHRALIWSGKYLKARQLLTRIRKSKLPSANRLLAELRQSCADRHFREARSIYAQINVQSDTSARWQAAQIVGDLQTANALLAPLDTPGEVRRLVQYMVYPTFDMREYPLLAQTLVAGGTRITPPTPVPAACPAN